MNLKLTTWLNEQKPWLKNASCLLLEKGALDKNDYIQLKNIIKGIISAPVFEGFLTDEVSSETKLHIQNVGSISGVDRLNPRTPLSLANSNMIVIYGANGSGKSGYVRLLKEICGKKSPRPLKHNVFSTEQPSRTCEIEYVLNGESKKTQWKQENGAIHDLRGVDIFDSLVGAVYIDSEMEVAYAPQEVSILARLVDVCKQVETLLLDEQSKLVSELPSMPKEYLGTTVAQKYASLRNHQRELTTWTPEAEKRLTQLEQLLSADPEITKKALEVQKEQAESLLNQLMITINAVSPDSVAEIVRQIQVVADNQRANDDAATAFSGITLLDGVASDSWRKMWEAARLYSENEAYESISFPNVGQDARCVLCNQPLDEQARKRLISFEQFVKGALSSALAESQNVLSTLIDGVVPVPEDKILDTMLIAAGIPQTLQDNLREVNNTLHPLINAVKGFPNQKGCHSTIPPLPPLVNVTIDELNSYIADVTTKVDALKAQIDPVKRLNLESEHRELKARKWTVQQTVAIQSEIERLAKVDIYKTWISETGTRPISLKASELASELITSEFVGRFNRELVGLGAKNIQVEIKNTRTTGAKPQYRLTLRGVVPGTKISDILSEGEHRIVALAAFLADVTGKQSSTPFIFDDPISSLDQRFEEKTAKRLAQLSESQQVIVFTHRLSFMNLILENRKDSTIIGISAEDWGTGQPGETPIFAKNPTGALNELKVARLAKARKALCDEGTQGYYIHGKAICSDFRILMERIIEQVLLDDVLVRHRRVVKTLKIHSLSRISVEDCNMVDDMMSRYSDFEHSQSCESPIDIPPPDEIEQDIVRVVNWLTDRSEKKAPVSP